MFAPAMGQRGENEIKTNLSSNISSVLSPIVRSATYTEPCSEACHAVSGGDVLCPRFSLSVGISYFFLILRSNFRYRPVQLASHSVKTLPTRPRSGFYAPSLPLQSPPHASPPSALVRTLLPPAPPGAPQNARRFLILHGYSRLDSGRVGAACAWRPRESWTGKHFHLGTSKEVFDAETFTICQALRLFDAK